MQPFTQTRKRCIKIFQKNTTAKTVNHGIGKYVNPDSCTNTIEGAFSYSKRMIFGIYHHISEKRIDKYADMFCFRFNTCELSKMERIKKLTWNNK